jgi:hypothetical protein
VACSTPTTPGDARAEPPAARPPGTPAASTVAPSVPRAPRQETLTVANGQLVRASGTLQVGDRAFDQVAAPARVCAAGAGRVFALTPGAGTWVAWIVDGDAVTSFPTFLPRTSRPPLLVPSPRGDAVWVVDADRRGADRIPFAPTAGRLVTDAHVPLPGDAAGDVAVLADDRVVVSTSHQVWSAREKGTRELWSADTPVERLLADGPGAAGGGGLWVLTRGGAAVHLTAAGTPDRTVSFDGIGMAMAVDGDELAVVAGTWDPTDRTTWRLHLIGPSGTVWSVDGGAEPAERTVVLLPDRVVVGSASAHRAFRRSDGTAL